MLRIVNWKIRLRSMRGDEGIAMIMVMGVSIVLLLLVTLALSVSLSGVTKTKNDENWNGAIAAAYAGIDDFKSKIAEDNTYYLSGNPLAAFSSSSTLTMPIEANPAFGIGASGSWAYVPNADGSPSTAAYRYEVDNSQYSNTGVLRIRSTGRVGNETRSVVANLRQKGFIDFLYYTTYEIQDREISGDPAACEQYWWNGRSSVSGGCSEIAFGESDVLTGPVHSNDAIRVCSAEFTGKVTTSYQPASGERWRRMNSLGSSSGCASNPFVTKPEYALPLNMPPTNASMRNEVRTDLAEVQRPGCLYTGPTSISYNSDGTMTIRSPWTIKTQVSGNPATSGTLGSECGTPGPTGLGSASGQKIAVPVRNLIYVQNVPFGTPGVGKDPNLWATGTYPEKSRTPTNVITYYKDSDCATNNFVGYPRANEYIESVTKSYGCTNGDVFVQGSMHAQSTVVSENYVYVVGDITYVNPESDVLGLVGQNSVFVYNPVSRNCSGGCSYSSLLPDNRTISAALLSVAHTVQVQNYDRGGSQGTLTIKGAIAQKFRGIVRSGSNGYAKMYLYDERFRYVAPPKFLSPVSTTYGISVLVEVKTAFNPNGSAIAP
jgi:hypothetical protein